MCSPGNLPHLPADTLIDPLNFTTRKKGQALPPLQDPIWDAVLPERYGGLDFRVLLLEVDAFEKVIIDDMASAAGSRTVYDYIVAPHGRPRISSKTKHVFELVDQSAAAHLQRFFKNSFGEMSLGKTRAATGYGDLQDPADLPKLLLRHAAVTQAIICLVEQLTVHAADTSVIPWLAANADAARTALAVAPPTMANLPESPVKDVDPDAASEGAYQRQVKELQRQLAEAKAVSSGTEVSNQEQAAVSFTTAQLQALIDRTGAQPGDKRLHSQINDSEGEFGLKTRIPTPTERAAQLAKTGARAPGYQSKTRYVRKLVVTGIRDGVATPVRKLLAIHIGSANQSGRSHQHMELTDPSESRSTGSEAFTITKSQGSNFKPASIRDYTDIASVLCENWEVVSPADAENLKDTFITWVITTQDFCKDWDILEAMIDGELQAYTMAFVNGTPPTSTSFEPNTVDHHRREVSKVRERRARDDAAKQRDRDHKRSGPGNPDRDRDRRQPQDQRNPVRIPPNGTANIGPSTRPEQRFQPQLADQLCRNHARGFPCSRACASNGNCPYRHDGAYGAQLAADAPMANAAPPPAPPAANA